MKKIYAISLALVVAASSISAKDLSEARIYLNPGHGSWGPNDRPMGTISYPADPTTERPDTCGFYESNTNLWKVLRLGATLEKLGAKKENIMYSRVKNGPFPYVKGAPDAEIYNRNLSEICEEVEANNFDYFLSVHSNAASEGSPTNYPLFIYRGKDGKEGEYQAGSYDKADIAWNFLNSNGIDPMSAYTTSKNIRGDVSFYGSESERISEVSGKTYSGYLGVLKHGAPGFLSEGYFHTYQPARHRALNQDYCAQEGIRYARGIVSYFGAEGEKTGYIMGTVKDLHEKIVNKLFNYAPKTNDQWLPLNGAVVTLNKGGQKIAEYKVDNNYNGVFVFENLVPGNDYTLECTMAGYKPLLDEYKKPITVKANETAYPMIFLESETYTPPVVVYVDYPDPVQDSFINTASEYEMKQEFVNKASDVLAGKTIRRSILRNGSLYVLALDADNKPFIYQINPETQALIKQISTEGTQGGVLALADIAFTADNILIGCNKGKNQFSDEQVEAGDVRGTFRAYKWDNPDAKPTEWFTSQNSGNYYRAWTGNTLAVSGASNDCRVMTTAVTTGASTSMRFVEFTVVDNALASTLFINKDTSAASNYTTTKLGEDMQLSVSPLAPDQYIIDGSLTTPIEFHTAGQNVDAPLLGKMSNELIKESANGATYFKYAKHSLMAAPVTDADGKNIGAKLFDITNGLDKAKLISTTNTSLDAIQSSYAMATGVVDNANINLYLTQDNVVNKFTTMGVKQPVIKSIFAYNLNVVKESNGSFTFTFDANDNAIDANILFYDKIEGTEVGRIALSDVKVGKNSITVTDEDLPGNKDQEMRWSVSLSGKSIPTISQLNNNSAEFTYTRAFFAIDNSTESNYFGRIYVNDRTGSNAATNGLYAYNPDWSRINSKNYNGGQTFGSNYRISIDSKGTIYIPDWSDPHSGVFIADPANLEGAFTQLFVGERNGDGLFINNGVKVGGSSPGVCLLGEGENTKLYVYSEDLNANDIAIYNIGTTEGIAKTWDKAPSAIIPTNGLQANGNGNIVVDKDGGMWIAQTRNSGQNTKGVPSLIYMKADGTVTFNSGDGE